MKNKKFEKNQKLTKLKVNVEGFEKNCRRNAEEIVPQKARVFIENQVIQEAEDISQTDSLSSDEVSFVSFIPFFVFAFWSLLATKLRKYYILQGKMGKMEKKNRKENHATKVTKIPKNQKTKIWDERNIN